MNLHDELAALARAAGPILDIVEEASPSWHRPIGRYSAGGWLRAVWSLREADLPGGYFSSLSAGDRSLAEAAWAAAEAAEAARWLDRADSMAARGSPENAEYFRRYAETNISNATGFLRRALAATGATHAHAIFDATLADARRLVAASK